MKLKLVLFDLGGTLINYDNSPWPELGRLGCIEGANFLKKEMGLDISAEALNEKLHNAIGRMIESRGDDEVELDLVDMTTKTLAELGINLSDGFPEKFIGAYYKPIGEQITLFPYAGEILRKIKNAGMKIGLVSNTIFPAQYHRREMRSFGLLEYFDFTLFSSEEKIRKPGKRIYKKALSLGQANPEEAIFIGDRLKEDVQGPQSVGIKSILKYIDGRDYSPDTVPPGTIHELKELEKIIFD
jgi:putative hydrolase of the HAD superfamily